MITNQRQYNVTRGQIARLESAIETAKGGKSKMDSRVYKAMTAGFGSQIKDLKKELEEYERLQQTTAIHLDAPEELAEALIKARVARGYSQKELAERLNLKPQQIQKYESTSYQSASLSRLIDVMNALDVELKADLFLDTA